MTPEQLEGNKLIALFLGGSPCIETIKSLSEVECFAFDDYSLAIDKLEYHTSWDWLIPVVEKINNCCQKTGYVDGISLFDFRIVGTPIIDVWQGCIDYIQWYNTYHQSQK